MKTSILQLDPHDDTISIRDKISWSKSQRIILVLPKKYRFSLTLLDLTLIKRESESQGSQVAVISRSRQLHEHAQNLGIPVFSSVPQAEKGNWQKEPERPQYQKQNQVGFSAILEKQVSVPSRLTHQTQPEWIRIVTMVPAIMALVVLAVFLLPSAIVKVYPVTEKQKISMEIKASDKINAPSISGMVPATSVPLVVTGEISAKSTGTVEIPMKKANGRVNVTNQGQQVIYITPGLVFSTIDDDPQKFISLEKNEVVLQPGSSTSIEVEAVNPGRQGNIDKGQILTGETLPDGSVIVTIESPLVGGESMVVPSPSENDYGQLKETLFKSLQTDAKNMIKKDALEDHFIGEVSLEKILVENRSNPVGEPSDTLTLSISAQYQYLEVMTSDLVTLFSRILDLSIENSKRAIDNNIEISQMGNSESLSDGEMILNLTASRQITRKWNKDEISNLISGRRAEVAGKILDDQVEHTQPAEIVPGLRIWRVMPFMSSRIQFVEVFAHEG